MARKLKSEEAEVFTGALDNSEIPTDADAFLRSLLDKQDEPLEMTLVPGMWISNAPFRSFKE
ncbi:MAG TPA: hypothetical protein VEH04_02780 [Verrucomicrobiae bacterium]|nr:hypothetical protein [Verrucomicrobiae bacterium]